MAGKIEICPNKKCPYKDTEDNSQHLAFERKYVEGNCNLCPHCESAMKG